MQAGDAALKAHDRDPSTALTHGAGSLEHRSREFKRQDRLHARVFESARTRDSRSILLICATDLIIRRIIEFGRLKRNAHLRRSVSKNCSWLRTHVSHDPDANDPQRREPKASKEKAKPKNRKEGRAGLPDSWTAYHGVLVVKDEC